MRPLNKVLDLGSSEFMKAFFDDTGPCDDLVRVPLVLPEAIGINAILL